MATGPLPYTTLQLLRPRLKSAALALGGPCAHQTVAVFVGAELVHHAADRLLNIEGKAQYDAAMANYKQVCKARDAELAAATPGTRTSWGDVR